jgi:hypothetical protein
MAEVLSQGWAWPTLPALAANWGRAGAGVLVAAAILAFAWLAGGTLAGFVRMPRRDPRRAPALVPLGYGALSLLLFGLLLARLWFPVLMAAAWVIPGALALLSRRASRPRDLLCAVRGTGAPGVAALVLFALAVPKLLAPEAHYDAYTYSLAGPARWLGQHGLAVMFADYRALFPMLGELPYSLPLSLDLDQVPGMLSLALVLCGGLAALSLVPDGSRGWALFMLAGASSIPVLSGPKADGAVVGLTLLALALAAGGRAMAAAAFTAGLALGAKLSAEAAVAWVAVAAWLAGRRPRMVHLATALAVASPWFAKSWLMAGDPVYPLGSATLSGFLGDSRTAEAWRAWRFRYGIADRWLPVSVAMGLAGESAVLVWLLPFALVARARRWAIVAGLAVCAGWYAAMCGFEPPRLGFPVAAGVMFLSAGAVASVPRGREYRWAFALVLAVTVASRFLSVFTVGSWSNNPFPYLLGMEDARRNFRRTMTTYADLSEFLCSRPPGGSVMLAGEPQTWRLPVPALQVVPYGGVGEPWFWKAARESVDDAGMLKRFRQLNAGRIVVNPTRDLRNSTYFHGFVWDPGRLAFYADFFARYAEPEYTTTRCDSRQGMYYVYRLRARPLPRPAFLMHLPGTEAEFFRRTGLGEDRGPQEGLALALAAVKAMPPAGFYSARAGYAAWRAGQYALAAELCWPAVHAGQIEEWLLVTWGISLLRTGRYGEAAKAFENAARAYPDLAFDTADYRARARFLLAHSLKVIPEKSGREARAALEELEAGPFGARLAPLAGLLRLEAALADLRMGRRTRAEEGVGEAAKYEPRMAGLKLPELAPWLDLAARQVQDRTR